MPDTDTSPVPAATVDPLHHGRHWQDLPPGFRFRTGTRTVTETDLIMFITWAGFTEPLFFDGSSVPDGRGRLIPAALTYAAAEGLVIQTGVFQGTGVAFTGMELTVRQPVYVGDTIAAIVTVTQSRATRHAERGLVLSTVSVRNQHDEEVLVYSPARLIRGRSSL